MNWPSVTQVLNWALPKDFPCDDYYLRRGTYVHRACDIIARGLELDEAHSSYALGLKDHHRPLSRNGNTESWLTLVREYQVWLAYQREVRPQLFVELISSEYEVRDEIEMYVGHPDQLWRLADGSEAIIDLKTGTAPKSTALQTAAYDLARPAPERRRRFALQLQAGVPAKLIEYRDSRDYNAFRLLVRAYWIANGGTYSG